MFQSFQSSSRPDQGPPRLSALRQVLSAKGLDGFIIPRADAHQGEYVAARDARLAWLTGFTGSAGFCIVLPNVAGVFVDGRYRAQVRTEVDPGSFTPVNWPEVKAGAWILEQQAAAGVGAWTIGFDPWLHTRKEIEDLEAALQGSGTTLCPTPNLIDAIWADQPAPPLGKVSVQPLEFAGVSAAEKRRAIGATLAAEGQGSAVLTLPDSISWLLNIRGSDIARNPVVQAFAVLAPSGEIRLFIAPEKLTPEVRAHLGEGVSLAPPMDFAAALASLPGPVRIDKATAPCAVSMAVSTSGTAIAWADDPCLLPKACKNPAEIVATTEAHLRDGAAMAEFLAWFDQAAPKGGLTEIDVVCALEGFRRATNHLREVSFDTICGTGPNGAVIHYRVTEQTSRPLRQDEIVVIDSGGQYLDGTTDITRTVAISAPPPEARAAFTRVLQGVIAISRLRWPCGLAGQHLDAIARYPLWLAGQDYDHGTGHGVGVYLCVHEGPQRLSRVSDVPLLPGMILSNEPGYYREGAFGIRIENLILVEEAPAVSGGDAHRQMLRFRTLTFAPIDRRLIDIPALSVAERSWLDAYHGEVLSQIGPRVSESALVWLKDACRPL